MPQADAHGKSTTIEELQQKTIKYTEARHRAVDSSTGEVEAVDTSETVRRDSDKHLKTDDSDGVSGPLKHASKTGSEETVSTAQGHSLCHTRSLLIHITRSKQIVAKFKSYEDSVQIVNMETSHRT